MPRLLEVPMSMMERLRRGTDSSTTRVLILAVLAVFIFWGAGSNQGGDTFIYADVDGTAITDTELRRVVSQAMRQQQKNLSEAEEKQLRSDVLDGLIETEAMVQEAEALGLAVDSDEVKREVVKETAFADETGKFSEKVYNKVIKQSGMTRATYEQQIHRSLLLGKLSDLATQGVTVSDAEVKSTWARQNTQIELTYVRLPDSAFLSGIVIPDAERDSWVTAHADEVKKRYDADYARLYDLPKRFQLRAIVLRTDVGGVEKSAVEARARAIHAEAVAGADFGELARRWSEDLTAAADGNLGNRAVDQLDPVLVAAAEKAGVEKITDVVETGRGYEILRVEGIEDKKVIPLDEAKADIGTQLLREERVGSAVQEYAGKLVAAWQTGGAVPRELTEAQKLSVDTTGLFSLADPEVPQIGPVPELAGLLPTATVGTVIATPFKGKGGLYVAAVTNRAEPDESQWEGQKGMVKMQVAFERKTAFVQAWKKDVMARAKVTRTGVN